jgi:hypothetical protein
LRGIIPSDEKGMIIWFCLTSNNYCFTGTMNENIAAVIPGECDGQLFLEVVTFIFSPHFYTSYAETINSIALRKIQFNHHPFQKYD